MNRSKDKHREDSKETLGKVIMSNLFSLGKIFLVCLVLIYFLTNYIVKPVKVYQDSMSPNIRDGTWAIGNAFAAHFIGIERYDVVVAQDKAKSPFYIVKRVLALPGETIYAKDDVVYVNGEVLEEPYLNTKYVTEYRYYEIFTKDFDPITLGEDEYFLVGDNRPISHDSREMGAFKKKTIKACGIFKIYTPK